ncbi:TDP-4-oxo-6-deoxy-D-glucose transaminase [Clostridium sporogenes]|nr:dTDP-4-amino-4,6-dideoxygalactose transaminase [Clostridium sporogenes]SUY61130.1 TDP-4-oxo-6-deoxy-D-glucose transaminase [Clostridium sporogenes]
MIPFNKPTFLGKELEYVKDAITVNKKICGDGVYTQKCNQWFQHNSNAPKVLLTTSCTHALEMSAILCDIKQDDEIIMPSYTFVSTAEAFVLRGAKIVFVDIRPDTMNIDENLIENAITNKTKVIVPVHYAGISCEMDKIMNIAKKYGLFVVEDAAQAVMSQYKGKALGNMGDFGCYSFHETKNYSMGEGGAILINNDKFIERSEIIREKGTNRSKFFRGQIDKYTWVDLGSSYLPSEINAAYLYAQLEEAYKINNKRLELWNTYYNELKLLQNKGIIELPCVPKGCNHNAHMFYIKVKDLQERTKLIDYLKINNISCAFHYIPLHSSPAGLKFGRFNGKDKYTTKESERLLRLPMFYELDFNAVRGICEKIKEFYFQ